MPSGDVINASSLLVAAHIRHLQMFPVLCTSYHALLPLRRPAGPRMSPGMFISKRKTHRQSPDGKSQCWAELRGWATGVQVLSGPWPSPKGKHCCHSGTFLSICRYVLISAPKMMCAIVEASFFRSFSYLGATDAQMNRMLLMSYCKLIFMKPPLM